MDNQSIKGRLSNIFLKKGKEGSFTKLFSNLDDTDRNAILSESHLFADELPIIADFRNSSEWSLITTSRVIWHDSKGVHTVPASEIMEVGINLERIQPPPQKLTTNRLGIRTKEQQLLEVQFEHGAPLFGAWNALRFFSVQNHKRDI
jgi:hypothetical protein